jgi:hypothetical protein
MFFTLYGDFMKKIVGSFSLFLLAALPVLANADMVLTNNTNSYAVAKVGGFCSTMAGDQGLIKPHQVMDIPSSTYDNIKMICGSGCDADIYMSKSCSGERVATVRLDKSGASNIRNYNVKGYTVTGGGFALAMDGGSFKNWLNYFFS